MIADDEAAGMMCCASCGIAAVDNVKLKKCDGGCDLVKYCSYECQQLHQELHEQECKRRVDEIRDDIQRRAAELRQSFLHAELHDKDLFTQPDGSHMGECPICFLPLSLDITKSNIMPCCSKFICDGCTYANQMRELK